MSETAPPTDAMRTFAGKKAHALMQALQDNELELAAQELESIRELTNRTPDDPDILAIRVVIAIQRGQALEALQYLNNLGEDKHPELRVLCLYSMQEPYWEGLAREIADAPQSTAAVAAAMTQMLACQSNQPMQ